MPFFYSLILADVAFNAFPTNGSPDVVIEVVHRYAPEALRTCNQQRLFTRSFVTPCVGVNVIGRPVIRQ